MTNLLRGAALAGAAALMLTSVSAFAGPTLDAIQERGSVICGVSQGTPGFSNPDQDGVWHGLDVDFCRALASAIFDDPTKVQFRPLSAKERFAALQSGEVDLLSRITTWTMSRDTQLGTNFAGVNYYDGQGLMVRRDLGVKSALELNGASICTQTGTTTELNITDYFRTNGLQFELVAFENVDELLRAYQGGRCDVYTSDQSSLYAQRLKLDDPNAHVVLPEVISKEPLGPVVRQGDDEWFNIVKWTHFAMLNAEELGVSSNNVMILRESTNPEIRRLLGVEDDFGSALNLTKEWAYRIVKHVGNYGESFDRNVGPNSVLGISRGLNELWKNGGLQYGPPIR